MSHYFLNDENLKKKEIAVKFYLNNKEFTFFSNAGIFSKNTADYGSLFLIKQLLKLNKVNSTLDAGCGYGLIGILLKYFDKTNILDAFDINYIAIELTKENAKKFNLDITNVFYSDGFTEVKNNYDRIVINPPIRAGKTVIYKMFEDSYSHLYSGGELFIVIRKDLGAKSAAKKIMDVFGNCQLIDRDSGYHIYLAKKN